jgi:O-antigen/teichoic acid export membrane protein
VTLVAALGRDSVVYGLGTVLTRASTLLLLPLFAAYFSPAEFGTLAMIGLLTMVAQPLFGLGLGAAMGPSYFEAGDAGGKAVVVWTAFAMLLASAALLLALGALLAPQLAALIGIGPAQSDLLLIALAGGSLNVISTALMQRVQFEGQAGLFLRLTALAAAVSVGASVILVAVLGWGMHGYLLAQALAAAVTCGAFFALALRAGPFGFSTLVARRLLALGLPLAPSFAFLFLLTHGNKALLEWRAGLDAVGVYAVGFTLGAALSVVTGGLAAAWYPFFMRYLKRQDEAGPLFGRIFSYYCLVVGSLCALFFIFAAPLVALTTPAKFHAAAGVVGPVALAHFFQGAFSLLLPGLYYHAEVRMVTLVQAAASVVLLLVCVPMIDAFGVAGAAWALVLGNFAMASLLYAWNRHRRAVYPRIAYEWKRLGAFAAAFSALVLLSAPLRSPLHPGVTAAVTLALTVALAAAVLALLSADERRLLFSRSRLRA